MAKPNKMSCLKAKYQAQRECEESATNPRSCILGVAFGLNQIGCAKSTLDGKKRKR